MTQAPRIDLSHGYMQFIRRNQLDRDEFDRVHERRKSEIRERLGEKPQKPANLYIPPHLRPKTVTLQAECRSFSRSDSDSQEDEKQRQNEERIRSQVRKRIERTHPTVEDICISLANYSLQEAERKAEEQPESSELFTLELTLASGEKKSIGVPRNTQAARLAKCLSREHSFNDSQCRNLRLFIEEQVEMRLARERRKETSLLDMSTSSGGSTTSSDSLPSTPCSTMASFCTVSPCPSTNDTATSPIKEIS